jgi:hypothetical protein
MVLGVLIVTLGPGRLRLAAVKLHHNPRLH